MHDCPFLQISWFSYTSLGLVGGQICILGKKQKSNKSYSKPYQTALLTAVKCRCLLGLETNYFWWSCWNQPNSTVLSACYAAWLLLLASSMGSKSCCAGERSFFMPLPRFRGSRTTSPPSQLVKGCVYVQSPWELLTDALHIAWMMPSQGNILFSLLPPSPFLPLRVFWSVCHFLILTLWRWKVACPACEGRETAVILLGQRPWAFFSKKPLEKYFFSCFFFFHFLHRRKYNEWGDLPGI